MAQLIEDGLLEAVKKDDVKAFNALGEKVRRGELRLGRFPVLSVLYLYGAKRILKEREGDFLKVAAYETLREPLDVSKRFSAAAGKCLRLYSDEEVSPLEMLLILDKTRRLKRAYPLTKPSAAVKNRLKAIYSVKYAAGIKFEGDGIILDRRPLKRGEKRRLAVAISCSALAALVAVGAPVTAVKLTAQRTTKPPFTGDATSFDQIDFGSTAEYTLKEDIILPENFSATKVNCKISGGGKKIVVKKGAKIGELKGAISNVVIESAEAAPISVISSGGEIKDVTINVTADVFSAEGVALVATTNYGVIDGVTVNVSGKITASASAANDEELVFGGVAQSNAYKDDKNYGVIKNCTVNYSDFSLLGETKANAVFGGVVGVNSGVVQGCVVTGKIVADTFDLGGVCFSNGGYVSECENRAELIQTSQDKGWSPIVGGVVAENTNIVSRCQNSGTIVALSNSEKEENGNAVAVGGIVYLNGGTLSLCKNFGVVIAKGNNVVLVGGIAARSYSGVFYSVSSGSVSGEGGDICAGGIVGRSEVYYTLDFFGYNFAWGYVDNCISECRVSADGGYAGGIIGRVLEAGVEANGAKTYFGGGATRSFFTGECVGKSSGSIAGGVGANIYATNSYTSGSVEYHNFEGNYYTAGTAFGAQISENGDCSPAEDKGAALIAEGIKDLQGYKDVLAAFEKKSD